jgi:hypothetical protein
MADGIFNKAKGFINAYVDRVANNDPTNSALVVVLLKAVESDTVLMDYDDLGSLLAAVGNVEADFSDGTTPYARKVLTDAVVSAPTPDDVNNWQASDIPDQTWTMNGTSVTNTLTTLLVCYDPDTTSGTDANIIPLTYHDFPVTASGADVVAEIPANGFYRAV